MKRTNLILITCLVFSIFTISCHYSPSEGGIEGAEQLSYEETEYNVEKRKTIKKARIAMEVERIETTILNLTSFLNPLQGHVYDYEINNRSYEIDQYQKNMDSTVLIKRLIPESKLSIKVPIKHADTFINYILHGDAQIVSLKISDDDITETLWEKKKITDVYSKATKAQSRKTTRPNISYDNNNTIQAIKSKALASRLEYQTQYLWFDISLSGKPFYTSTTSLAVKNYRTPVHIAFANSMIKGWHMCSDMLIALISIWPIILLLGIVFLILKKYRLRTS